MNFLAFGTLWFWILSGVSMVAVVAFLEHDSGAGATWTLIVTTILVYVFGDLNPVVFVLTHPDKIFRWLAIYFVAGTAWSIAKWWFYVRSAREEYDEKRTAFLSERNSWDKRSEADKKSHWAMAAPKKPSAADSKEKILRWMSFWPWSMVWTIINDPVKKAFRAIYRRLQAMFQRMADKAWVGTEADF